MSCGVSCLVIDCLLARIMTPLLKLVGKAKGEIILINHHFWRLEHSYAVGTEFG